MKIKAKYNRIIIEMSLVGIRKHYNMSSILFNNSIKPIKKKLDKMVGRKNYRLLTPRQFKLIIKHLEG